MELTPWSVEEIGDVLVITINRPYHKSVIHKIKVHKGVLQNPVELLDTMNSILIDMGRSDLHYTVVGRHLMVESGISNLIVEDAKDIRVAIQELYTKFVTFLNREKCRVHPVVVKKYEFIMSTYGDAWCKINEKLRDGWSITPGTLVIHTTIKPQNEFESSNMVVHVACQVEK